MEMQGHACFPGHALSMTEQHTGKKATLSPSWDSPSFTIPWGITGGLASATPC